MNTRTKAIFVSLVFALAATFASETRANVVGSDFQNFNATTNGLDFVTVHSSETLKPGLVNLGLFFNYAVNTLPYYEASPQNRLKFNDTLLGGDFNFGVGLGRNWDFGMSFPYLLKQTVNDETGAARGEFTRMGNTEVRVNTKYRVSGDDSQGVALVASVNFDRTVNNPYVGQGAGPTYNFEVAADRPVATGTSIGVNVGHRWRSPGTRLAAFPVEPYRNQIIASAAINHLLASIDTKFIGEIYGSFPTEKSADPSVDRSLSSLELGAGIKHDLNTQTALHVGGGTKLISGASSPDWRVYSGINYTFGPIYTPPPATIETISDERFLTRNINFEFNSDTMTGDYVTALQDVSSHIKGLSEYKKLVIEGHTDSVGGDDYNLKLSQKRADAIKNYLIKEHGLKAEKLEAVGYGESRPIADNGNYQGRQQNRRVEFRIQK